MRIEDYGLIGDVAAALAERKQPERAGRGGLAVDGGTVDEAAGAKHCGGGPCLIACGPRPNRRQRHQTASAVRERLRRRRPGSDGRRL